VNVVFWVDDARAGWWDKSLSWTGWEGWQIEKVNRSAWKDYRSFDVDVVDLIRTYCRKHDLERVYVVTDAQFGNDGGGGAKLLRALLDLDLLERGVIYSSEPRLDGLVSSRIIAVTPTVSVGAIQRFLLDGVGPEESCEERDMVLAAAIHSLKNAILPLKYDLETLESDGSTIDAITTDYFGGEAAYLSAGGHFGDVKGLETYVTTVLRRKHGASGISANAIVAAQHPTLSNAERESWNTIVQEIPEVSALAMVLGGLRYGPNVDIPGSLKKVIDAVEAIVNRIRDTRTGMAKESADHET
jgi:hypothetical protein